MTYDGLGNRLEVTTYTDGECNTTRYVLDGGTTLTEIGAEHSTFYLYGGVSLEHLEDHGTIYCPMVPGQPDSLWMKRGLLT
jgi:hypothetical protein